MQDFPNRLRGLRGGRSREEFAALVGISPRALINYELGSRMPKADVIELICTRTKVTADWLLFGTKPSDASDKTPPALAQHIENTENSFLSLSDVGQSMSSEGTEARLRREIESLNAEITRLYTEKRDLNREYYETCEALDAASIQRDKFLEERDAALARIGELEAEIASLKGG